MKSFVIVIAVIIVGIIGVYVVTSNQGSEVSKDSVLMINPVEERVQSVGSTTVSSTPTSNSNKTMNNIVTIETTKGTIVVELYPKDAPKAVENFTTLAGKGFYNGVIFHRIITGFMIQGGDPTGTGRGGPGYTFADELNEATPSYQKGYTRGTLAMANAGPNTNGSQFFIMHKDYPLPHNYTIFGHVIKGIEVVDAIATSKTDAGDKPLEKIEMKKVTVDAQ